MIMANSNSLKSGNNPLKCLIIDDELVAIKIIASNIEKLDFLIVSVFVCRGYELGYELCLFGAKRCTLRQTQGNKKSPTNH